MTVEEGWSGSRHEKPGGPEVQGRRTGETQSSVRELQRELASARARFPLEQEE